MRRSLPSLLSLLVILREISGYCDQTVRWLDGFRMESIYGMWYASGYAQHTPDLSDKPPDIGCIVLHIDDVTEEMHKEWFEWPVMKRNHTNTHRIWSNGVPPQHLGPYDLWTNRDRNHFMKEKILRLVWIEDGFRMEQNYVYNIEAPALWKYQLWREDEWDPEVPGPKKYEVIRIMKATPSLLVLHHCMESGDGRIFSLIFQRQPARMSHWDWVETKKLFYSYQISEVYREMAVCSACRIIMSSLTFIVLLHYFIY